MSLKVTIGTSGKKEIRYAIQEALLSCRRKFPLHEADLAVAFTTPALASVTLLKSIKQELKQGVPLIGCSGMALITPEGILNEGLAIMLIACPDIRLSCGSINQIKNKGAYLSGESLGSYIVSTVRNYHRETCLILTDGLLEDSSNFLRGLQSMLGRSFPIIGGGAASNANFKQTFQYYNEELITNGAVAALFAGKINYAIGIMHGWKPLGKIRVITESSANIIKKIDGKKAIHLYEDYFTKTLTELRRELFHINILYPIGLYLPGENEYLLRNVVSLNDDGSIVAQGDVPQDSQIRLMIGTKDSCLEAARRAAEQVCTDMRNKIIDFCLVVSSASRARLLGRKTKEEIKIIKDTIGENVPFIGFYSYGEHAPLKSIRYYGQSYYHNQAIAILGMGS